MVAAAVARKACASIDNFMILDLDTGEVGPAKVFCGRLNKLLKYFIRYRKVAGYFVGLDPNYRYRSRCLKQVQTVSLFGVNICAHTLPSSIFFTTARQNHYFSMWCSVQTLHVCEDYADIFQSSAEIDIACASQKIYIK